MEPVLTVRSARKTFEAELAPVRALRGVDLELADGEFVAIMGPSGCGKSTLLNLVAGLDTADDGEIVLAGEQITGKSEDELARMRRRHIGIVFQFFNLLEGMTVLENVVLPAMIAGTKRKPAETRARDLLDLLGLSDKASDVPAVLSGGQRQRLAIARALANKPTLLLADEPTGALDTDGGREVLELFKRLHADGQTILMVTHNDEVASAADRIIRMRDGRVEGEGLIEPVGASTGSLGVARDRSVDGVTMSRTLDSVETMDHPASTPAFTTRSGPLLPFAAPAFVVGVAAAGAALVSIAGVDAPSGVRYAATGVTVVWAIAGILIALRRRSEPLGLLVAVVAVCSTAALIGSAATDTSGGRLRDVGTALLIAVLFHLAVGLPGRATRRSLPPGARRARLPRRDRGGLRRGRERRVDRGADRSARRGPARHRPRRVRQPLPPCRRGRAGPAAVGRLGCRRRGTHRAGGRDPAPAPGLAPLTRGRRPRRDRAASRSH